MGNIKTGNGEHYCGYIQQVTYQRFSKDKKLGGRDLCSTVARMSEVGITNQRYYFKRKMAMLINLKKLFFLGMRAFGSSWSKDYSPPLLPTRAEGT